MSFPYLKRNLSTIFISPFPVNSCPSNHICSFLAMMSLRSDPTGMPTSGLAPAPTIKTVFDESIAYVSSCGMWERLPLNQSVLPRCPSTWTPSRLTADQHYTVSLYRNGPLAHPFLLPGLRHR